MKEKIKKAIEVASDWYHDNATWINPLIIAVEYYALGFITGKKKGVEKGRQEVTGFIHDLATIGMNDTEE